MSTTRTSTALEFRAWTSRRPEKQPLNETLARVHQERGSFRELTEASLQEEIATEGALQPDSSEDEDDDEDDDNTIAARRQPATSREELFKAKNEMLEQVRFAHNDIMLSLQAIALMESKYAQSQASVSFAPDIKAQVPPGSIGTDIWDAKVVPADPAREAQDKLLASKVRMDSLQQSADDLIAAATRLQDNVRKETVFWNETLAVSEKSWSISRIPGVPLLGVHFGFNGCAPEFGKRTIAALVGDSEGAVTLERGIGTKPKAVRALVRKSGQIIGASPLPTLPADGETTLDARIRHARDSVFDEELFHELLRESRPSTSSGVSLRGLSLCFDVSKEDETSIELELISLEDENALPEGISNESDSLAKSFLVAARLLLSQRHREKINRKREVPEPIVDKTEKERSFSILRPLLLLIKHHSNVNRVNQHLEDMAKVLRTTQVSTECQPARMGLALPRGDSMTIASLLRSFQEPLSSEAALWMIPSDDLTLELKVKIRTSPSIDGVDNHYSISQTLGQELHFDDVADTLAAADEVLAVLLGKILEGLTAGQWRLSLRDGVLTRAGKDNRADTMHFTVNGSSKTVTLHAHSSGGSRKAVWRLGDTGIIEVLKDVWKTLVR